EPIFESARHPPGPSGHRPRTAFAFSHLYGDALVRASLRAGHIRAQHGGREIPEQRRERQLGLIACDAVDREATDIDRTLERRAFWPGAAAVRECCKASSDDDDG